MRGKRLGILAGLGLALAAAPAAQAATGTASTPNGVPTFIAGGGTTNDLTVTRVLSGKTSRIRFEDANASIAVAAGSGCTALSSSVAECLNGSRLPTVKADTGDLDDRISSRSGAWCSCYGGSGNDTIRTGSGTDRLYGGAGDDWLDGGTGSDTFLEPVNGGNDLVTYQNHVPAAGGQGVRVTMQPSTASQGFSGLASGSEGDLIPSTVERVRGTSGRDLFENPAGAKVTWEGGAAADQFYGSDVAGGVEIISYADHLQPVNVGTVTTHQGGGLEDGPVLGTGDSYVNRESIEGFIGGRGDDVLRGVFRGELLDGHLGDDVLNGRYGADDLRGGSGTDRVVYDESAYASTGVVLRLPGTSANIFTGGNGHASVDGAGDRLERIEQGEGSAGPDYLQAAGGDELLEGRGGADEYVDFGGQDVVSYAHAPGPVRVGFEFPTSFLDGDAAGDTFRGGFEDLEGSAHGDTLHGDRGPNEISGGGGDDSIQGGAGADRLSGGPGSDAANWSDHTLPVTVTAGTAGADDGGDEDGPAGARDTVLGDVERFQLGKGHDHFTSSPGVTEVHGEDGDDTLDLRPGGPVRADGGLGDDEILGSDEDDELFGGDGADKITAGGGDDRLEGGFGPDFLSGQAGGDIATYQFHDAAVRADLDGLAGDGNATDGTARDTIATNVEGILGTAFNDRLIGGPGPDLLRGGAGNDTLEGLGGRDELQGMDGTDTLRGGPASDVLTGNDGKDTVTYSERSEPITATLDGVAPDGGASDTVAGDLISADVENLIGGSGADRLTGDDLPNRLTGGPGADLLRGLAGTDVFDARDGAGTDTLECGANTDSGLADPGDSIASDCEAIT